MMKTIISVCTLCIFATSLAHARVKVCLTQIISHPSLNRMAQGVVDELKEQNIDFDYLFYDAQGQIPIAMQIANTCLSQNPQVIVALTTPSAQAILKARKEKNIPVVFGGVTDPVGAGLVPTLEKAQPLTTGTIDAPDPYQQLTYFKDLQPALKNLGILYNPGEQNSVLQVESLQHAALAVGIQIIPQPVSKLTDIASSLRAIHLQCDALYVPNDNLLISGIETVLKTARALHKPVYVSDPESVDKGADGALANDQYQVGRETGKLAARFIQGERLIPSVKVNAPLKLPSPNQNLDNPK